MVAWLSGMEHRFRDYPFVRPWFNTHPSHVVINLYYTLDDNTSTATVAISLSQSQPWQNFQEIWASGAKTEIKTG